MRPAAPTATGTIRKARAGRARQRREGMIVLLLMLVLMMASGTAVFTMQSTQYEQRSASAVGEANWARGLAECTTLAGIAYAEDPLSGGAMSPTLGLQWQANGSTPAVYTQKYAIPAPTAALAAPPLPGAAAPNVSGSVLLMDSPAVTAPVASNVPGTGSLATFLPPSDRNRASPTYPLFADYDSQNAPVPGLRFYRAHWLQERLTVFPASVAGVPGTVGKQRTRTVVTGFAEINVWGDRPDSGGVRGIHELDAISRGYIDTIL